MENAAKRSGDNEYHTKAQSGGDVKVLGAISNEETIAEENRDYRERKEQGKNDRLMSMWGLIALILFVLAVSFIVATLIPNDDSPTVGLEIGTESGPKSLDRTVKEEAVRESIEAINIVENDIRGRVQRTAQEMIFNQGADRDEVEAVVKRSEEALEDVTTTMKERVRETDIQK